MNTNNISKILEEETSMLEALRPQISRKLLFALEERLKAQRRELEGLLGLESKQNQNFSKYTFVLDSQYFDQIFLN